MVDIATKAIESNAGYSDCGKHRYYLDRLFAPHRGRCINFIMLNPSTATEEWNDPTVLRCENRALLWGYESMIITNLFSFRATDPRDMKAAGIDAIGGAENDREIKEAAWCADMIICAWGGGGKHLGRGKAVLASLKEKNADKLHCLKQSKDGTPWHPLYLPYSAQPIKL